MFPPKRAEVDASTVPTVVETSRTTSVNNNGTKMASANEKQVIIFIESSDGCATAYNFMPLVL